jgi:hypothetical protein
MFVSVGGGMESFKESMRETVMCVGKDIFSFQTVKGKSQ